MTPPLSENAEQEKMATDPWSRPTVDELQQILDSIEPGDFTNAREAERLSLNVPAEIKTMRGNTVEAMTREISRQGIGLLHRGSISPGPVTVKMASETRKFEYHVQLEWCYPCENGMFLSGGRFIQNALPGPKNDGESGTFELE
ncbi:PilZ domain-containing protein [Calycomorphotria hydatis]|uniref:PilZ domain-containing protein n=1 Tax=Calycomorphotria hydatis TaxID=2528027 RepID=A0A517TD40_9PLAN|nr:PilZ domain-containing protein [Calycomorphotria hydatis]QDT66287.1 hypothetical protein V22_35520 [Calycomorphotria hydatis]